MKRVDQLLAELLERVEVVRLGPPTWWRRQLCRWFGHRALVANCEPVTTFFVCRRCGKFGR